MTQGRGALARRGGLDDTGAVRHSLLALTLLAACGAPKTPDAGNGCSINACPPNQRCEPLTDQCVLISGSACTAGCGGQAPFCDEARATCVACTATEGCGGPTPHCNTTAASGAYCVECIDDTHCPGSTCNLSTRACRSHPDAGQPDAGQPDAGGSACTTRCTGTTSRCHESTGVCVQCLLDNQCGGGSRVCNPGTHRCELAPSDGGACINNGAPPSCTVSCTEGFMCLAGLCVLNGGNGPVQVTVRWDTDTDVDLHLDEPMPDGGVCAIYYGDTGGASSNCGAVGSLDLDSNAGCSIDNVDIENIIYPPGAPAPSGTYVVRVDYYDSCAVSTSIPFEIEVRANGQTNGWCDVFTPSDSDNGSAGSGRVITTFVVP